ncbi:MAG TPA: hypothetical protein VHC69_21265 [Polyangiaceae bacterium]|nr:hypothetical protein [Polyangiaceae bacterium]
MLKEIAPATSEANVQIRESADEVVSRLRHLDRVRNLEHALEIGHIIHHFVFNGSSMDVVESGAWHPLYRAVAAHASLPFSRQRLWFCVRLYALVQRFPDLRASKHLGVSHARAILTLPEPIQEHLIAMAESERWSRDRMEAEAARYRRSVETRGRPPVQRFIASARRIRLLAGELRERVGPRVRGRISAAEAQTALELLRVARLAIAELEGDLDPEVIETVAFNSP